MPTTQLLAAHAAILRAIDNERAAHGDPKRKADVERAIIDRHLAELARGKPVVRIVMVADCGRHLHGFVHDHPRFPDGTYVKTSAIVARHPNGDVETLNTLYRPTPAPSDGDPALLTCVLLTCGPPQDDQA